MGGAQRERKDDQMGTKIRVGGAAKNVERKM